MARTMRYAGKVVVATLTLLMLTALCQKASGEEVPIHNLSEWQVAKRKIVQLNGKSEFYWSQLLTPNDFQRGRNTNPTIVDIPASWTKYKIATKHLTSSGYATYHFRILQPRERDSVSPALKIPVIHSNYTIWINGQHAGSVGQVASSQYTAKPCPRIAIIPLWQHSQKDTLDIVLQVSNFDHPRSGILESIQYGDHNALVSHEKRYIARTNMLLGGIAALCTLLALSFIIKRKVQEGLLLLITMLSLAGLITTELTHQIIEWFPSISWKLFHQLRLISLLATSASLLYCLHLVLPKDISLKVIHPVVGTCVLAGIVVLATPPTIFVNLRFLMHSLIGAYLISICLWPLPRAIRRKSRYATLILFASLLLTLTFILQIHLSYSGTLTHIPAAIVGLAFLTTLLIIITANHLANYPQNNSNSNLYDKNTHQNDKTDEEENVYEAKLKQFERQIQKQNNKIWNDSGIATITASFAQDKNSLEKLCENAVKKITKYLNANIATIYIARYNLQNLNYTLNLTASYGLTSEQKQRNQSFHNGESLVGACYKDATFQHITDLPEEFLTVHSGLGAHTPPSIILSPLLADAGIVGVMEIGRFAKFQEFEVEFIKQIAKILANNIVHAKANEDYQQKIELLQNENQALRQKL